jgi:hypothetical protein
MEKERRRSEQKSMGVSVQRTVGLELEAVQFRSARRVDMVFLLVDVLLMLS